MTKEEKAVLAACQRRFLKLLEEDGLANATEVLRVKKGNTTGIRLIRAVARWQLSLERHQSSTSKSKR